MKNTNRKEQAMSTTKTAADLTRKDEGKDFYVRTDSGFAGRALTFRGAAAGSFLEFAGPNGEQVFVPFHAEVEPA